MELRDSAPVSGPLPVGLPAPAAATLPTPPQRSHAGPPSAPPLWRGSMVAQPWCGLRAGLWAGLRAALGGPSAQIRRSQQTPQTLQTSQTSQTAHAANAAHTAQSSPPGAALPPAPWQHAARGRRRALMLTIALATLLATTALTQAPWGDGPALLHGLQTGLFALLFAWVAAGCTTALMGFFVLLRDDPHRLSARSAGSRPIGTDVRTALVMPICHEDVATVFAGLRATCESLAATGALDRFDVYLLSDSSDPDVRSAEVAAWAELRAVIGSSGSSSESSESSGGGRVFYRWRRRRTQRKAGNVADFCRRWGRHYRYMVVLDADSVMSGDCLTTLVRLMEAHPQAGILQTAPRAWGHATLHARAQQFTARVAGRLFTAGMQYWQLGEAHYWGHNAIIRVEPFMRHCALARLPGNGALGGELLSHDFVEAAMMRRAGWQVWMVHDLAGSYEQAPPHLLAELQRDRRWCQGNLQNAQLLAEPGLHPVHRAMLATGTLAYVSAPLWLVYLLLGAGLWWLDGSATAAPGGPWAADIEGLWIATLGMLALPRVLGVLAIVLRREQAAYGGAPRLVLSALLEAGLSLLQAPLRMVAHTLFVVGALGGWKLQWTSPPRRGADVGWREAAQRFAPASLGVVALTAALWWVHSPALPWLIPVGLPLLLAIPTATLTSRSSIGQRWHAAGLLWVPEESQPPAVLRRAAALQRRASANASPADPTFTGPARPWHPARPDPVTTPR